MDDQFKYIIRLDSREESLYRYETDRLEEHNLIASETDTAKRLRDVLMAKLHEVNERYARRP